MYIDDINEYYNYTGLDVTPFVFIFSSYLQTMKGMCDPFQKMKVSKIQTALQSWAKDKNFPLDVSTVAMKARNKKIVTKTFHSAGMVVPWSKKSELGYRELIETDGECWNFWNLLQCNETGVFFRIFYTQF